MIESNCCDKFAGGLYIKIVLFAVWHAAPLPENAFGIFKRFVETPLLCLDDLQKIFALRRDLSRRAIGKQDLAVLFVFAEKARPFVLR